MFVPQLLWLPRCFRQHAEMVKESLRCSYALRATTPCAGKAAVREKTCGHHGTAQRPGGIGKNRSPSSCRRGPRLTPAAAYCGGGDAEKAKRGRLARLRPRLGPFGRGCRRRLRADLYRRQKLQMCRIRRSRGGARLWPVKSRNCPRPALSRALQMAALSPRALSAQCSFSSSAPFAARRSFRSGVTRGFVGTPADSASIGAGRRPGGRRSTWPPCSSAEGRGCASDMSLSL